MDEYSEIDFYLFSFDKSTIVYCGKRKGSWQTCLSMYWNETFGNQRLGFARDKRAQLRIGSFF